MLAEDLEAGEQVTEGDDDEDDREAFEGFLRDTCRLQRRFPVRQEGRDLDVEVYRRR